MFFKKSRDASKKKQKKSIRYVVGTSSNSSGSSDRDSECGGSTSKAKNSVFTIISSSSDRKFRVRINNLQQTTIIIF